MRHMYLRIEEFYKETPVSKDIISLFQGQLSLPSWLLRRLCGTAHP